MKELVRQTGLEKQFYISSAAATAEEIGNDMYPNAKAELKRHGIPFVHRRARQLRSDEYNDWDFIIAMDQENLDDINYIVGHDPYKKVRLLMSFADENKSVADPWYTRDFAGAYADIYKGCEALLKNLMEKLHGKS